MYFNGTLVNENKIKLGTFNVVGDVIIDSYDPWVSAVELDPSGTVLTIKNLYNLHHSKGTFADATDDLYIEFTPSALIKNSNDQFIDTNTKVREANGSKHF